MDIIDSLRVYNIHDTAGLEDYAHYVDFQPIEISCNN